MSTYLVAFAISDFTSEESHNSSYKVNVSVQAATKYMTRGFGNYAKDVAPGMMQHYENMFNLSYPSPKMDLFAVPHKGSAMENWGLNFFGFKYFLCFRNA